MEAQKGFVSILTGTCHRELRTTTGGMGPDLVQGVMQGCPERAIRKRVWMEPKRAAAEGHLRGRAWQMQRPRGRRAQEQLRRSKEAAETGVRDQQG